MPALATRIMASLQHLKQASMVPMAAASVGVVGNMCQMVEFLE